MNGLRLFNVIGMDDLEGTVFARCTTLAKAVIAQDKLGSLKIKVIPSLI